jgi:hypothetical protein
VKRNDRGCVVHNRSSGARVSFIMYEDERMMIIIIVTRIYTDRTEDRGISIAERPSGANTLFDGFNNNNQTVDINFFYTFTSTGTGSDELVNGTAACCSCCKTIAGRALAFARCEP